MKEIMELVEKLKEELKDAKAYAECYLDKKGTPAGQKYAEMAKDELKHSEYIHQMAVDKIQEVKDSGIDMPEIMDMLWNEKHEWYIKKVNKVKAMLSM